MKLLTLSLHFALVLSCFNAAASTTADSSRLVIPIQQDEAWWIGIVNHGSLMPLTSGYRADLHANFYGNQAQPLLLSSKGNVVWSADPFIIKYGTASITLTKPTGDFVSAKAGSTLKEAYLYASNTWFPPSGKMPATELFTSPQYNTWIELLYNQNQKDVLKYAKIIVDNGFPPGVIMIDDNWQEDYGNWKFHPARFPNPGAMVDSLHQMGFKVMLWVCPFVSPDSETFRRLQQKELLLKETDGYPKLVRWWNGASGVVDFTNPGGVNWFHEQLQFLIDKYHIDGYKFDAGDPEYYVGVNGAQQALPHEHAELFAKIGLSYPFNEYRVTWKMGGQPLAQRLRDKGHTWEDLQVLVPNILLQGIMGYPFTCPDMIGGGEMGSFLNLKDVNQDLVVRSAQVHALMPMMQFSVAPWRILDKAHFNAIKASINTRSTYIDVIKQLAFHAATTGEPVVRLMCYEFPNQGFEKVNDQFMLGDKILVAPILHAGDTRKVILPKGKWQDTISGKTISGPKTIEVKASLDQLPVFVKK